MILSCRILVLSWGHTSHAPLPGLLSYFQSASKMVTRPVKLFSSSIPSSIANVLTHLPSPHKTCIVCTKYITSAV
ncbi:hypothetical protein DM02DRAFT_141424 [Periconia macrospinosa]|uniref:Uncharacterized protein n=1 Tax=Periconia macrospinosa TaxID=97972 RepID=A0A2V1DBZ9_9PLEO|nr:hypothetical protein DM02DRAFT_141424 [Periconia macrospinosa]